MVFFLQLHKFDMPSKKVRDDVFFFGASKADQMYQVTPPIIFCCRSLALAIDCQEDGFVVNCSRNKHQMKDVFQYQKNDSIISSILAVQWLF